MKATELRIGNFCQDNVTKTTIKVVELTNECITTYVIDRSKFPLKDGWKLQPIPLTEEWLLKFGFERTDLIDNSNDDWTWLFYQKDSIYIDGSDLTIETATGIVIKVEYVHQLQNLYFALTGEELTL